MADDDHDRIHREFGEAVNMTPRQIEDFLETEDSHRVGQKPDGGGESIGHASGRRIVEIKRKTKADLTEADYAHMKKVVSYVARHSAQGPKGDKADSDWRYSLMNWGHDPLK